MEGGIGTVGRLLVITGLFIAILGLFLIFFEKIPFIGKLPGDIIIRRKNFTFYFPLMTGILLSILISIILYIIGRLR